VRGCSRRTKFDVGNLQDLAPPFSSLNKVALKNAQFDRRSVKSHCDLFRCRVLLNRARARIPLFGLIIRKISQHLHFIWSSEVQRTSPEKLAQQLGVVLGSTNAPFGGAPATRAADGAESAELLASTALAPHSPCDSENRRPRRRACRGRPHLLKRTGPLSSKSR
jgi:hypothetical protein